MEEMRRTNKKLFDFINSLDVDTYVIIALKYGGTYVDIAEGKPQELLDTLTANLYKLRDFRYVNYISLNGFEVSIYLEDIRGD